MDYPMDTHRRSFMKTISWRVVGTVGTGLTTLWLPRQTVLLVERFRGKPTENMLAWALSEYHPCIALASSFSREDIVLIAMMTDIRADAQVFALDTGRLNKEMYEAAEAVRRNLGVSIEWHFPDREAVGQLHVAKGLHSLRERLESSTATGPTR